MEHPSQMCENFEQLATFNFNYAKFLKMFPQFYIILSNQTQLATFNFNYAKFLKMFPQFYIILSNQTQLENLHKLSKILN